MNRANTETRIEMLIELCDRGEALINDLISQRQRRVKAIIKLQKGLKNDL